MINERVGFFTNKRFLLLQGPMGPFFNRLSKDLTEAGAKVYKVNFNGGDWAFFPQNAFNYRGGAGDWPVYFTDLINRLNIDMVVLFGDCRPLHSEAHKIATQLGVKIAVFEEGYVRPNYITLELTGVNGFSQMSKDPAFYLNQLERHVGQQKQVGNSFWLAASWAVIYYFVAGLLKPIFFKYQHYRPLSWLELLPWVRSIWRKLLYKVVEHKSLSILTGKYSKRFFLVPLQVHNDFQVHTHSDYHSVQDFIKEVICSFAKHAPNERILVIKHHPLDRGYYDYTRLIQEQASVHGVESRCIYIHDQHLPTLLNHAVGAVVINSTVGLSALIHGVQVKVCGDAAYDIKGLTFSGALEQFWKEAERGRVHRKLLFRYYCYLIAFTQVNGNFYRRLPNSKMASGLDWYAKRNK